MDSDTKNNPVSESIKLSIGFVFFFYLAVSPFGYIQNAGIQAVPGSGRESVPYSSYRFDKVSMLMETSGSDVSKSLQKNIVPDRNLRDYKRFFNRILISFTYSFLGFGILINLINAGIRKTICKSVLALSMGGHAPPETNY